MTVEFNEEKISAALKDFYNATGIDMNLLKVDFSPASECRWQNSSYCNSVQSSAVGCDACRLSDMELLKKCNSSKRMELHICHAGLVDVVIPIVYDDLIIGYINFGRMKPNTDFSVLEPYIRTLGLNAEDAKSAYNDIPFYDAEKIRSVSNIATLMAKYILLENMLRPKTNSNLEKAVSYIKQNLAGDLTIKTIARKANISKSVLYKTIHDRFHCTVSGYVTMKRVEASIVLLTNTDLSMEEVSQKVGFSSASYYSKAFKKQTGMSPLRYRKTHQS